jgi:hypothetical protein
MLSWAATGLAASVAFCHSSNGVHVQVHVVAAGDHESEDEPMQLLVGALAQPHVQQPAGAGHRAGPSEGGFSGAGTAGDDLLRQTTGHDAANVQREDDLDDMQGVDGAEVRMVHVSLL